MLPLPILDVSFSQILYCSSFLVLLPTLGRCKLIHQHNEFDLSGDQILELKKNYQLFFVLASNQGCSIYEPNREEELLLDRPKITC